MFEDIRITYYVNPNLFWFKHEGNPSASQEKLNELERRIEAYRESISKTSFSKHYSPAVGELVIVRHCTGSVDKWVRARVDHEFKFLTGSDFICWAVDYGFPLRSSSEWIRKLESADLQNEKNETIFKAGLNAGPAVHEFNFLKGRHETIKAKYWSDNAMAAAEAFLFDAEVISFRPECRLNEHLFGDVIVKQYCGKLSNLTEFLTKLDEAVECTDYFSKEYQFLVHKQYWECQRHNKIFKIEENVQSHYNYEAEILHGGSVTDSILGKELSRKISDWDRRNSRCDANHLNESSSEKVPVTTNHLVETEHPIKIKVRRIRDDSAMALPFESDSLIDKMKEMNLPKVPTQPTESQIDKKLGRYSVFKQNVKQAIFPAGYRQGL